MHNQFCCLVLTSFIIIRSSAKFTYDDAQRILDNSSADEQISKDIHSLYQLSTTLREKRQCNGAFTQKRDELEYEFQYEEPVTVSTLQKNNAANMVKEFLFLANKSVAQKISSQFPNHALLRRHAPPNERKIVSKRKKGSLYIIY
jgi:protein SSD1